VITSSDPTQLNSTQLDPTQLDQLNWPVQWPQRIEYCGHWSEEQFQFRGQCYSKWPTGSHVGFLL